MHAWLTGSCAGAVSTDGSSRGDHAVADQVGGMSNELAEIVLARHPVRWSEQAHRRHWRPIATADRSGDRSDVGRKLTASDRVASCAYHSQLVEQHLRIGDCGGGVSNAQEEQS